jgi:hypothetical protein
MLAYAFDSSIAIQYIGISPGNEILGRACFVDNSIPSEPRIVNDDVDFAIPKLGRLRNQGLQVVLI